MNEEKKRRIQVPGTFTTRRDVLKGTAAAGVGLAAPSLFVGAGVPLRSAAAASGAPESSYAALLAGFREPLKEYAPIDNWWWEAGQLDKEKLTWQLEEFKDKGTGGTWFYVRWVYGEALSSIPAYWSDEWWDYMRFALQEHERLGLQMWFSTWEANGFIQDLIRPEMGRNPEFVGRNLVIYRAESKGSESLDLEISPEDEILDVAAYRKDGNAIDYGSRRDLKDHLRNRKLEWDAPDSGWLLTVIAIRPAGLNYLNAAMGDRWHELFLGEYERRVPEFIGTVLTAFGVDEHSVLEGSTAFSRSLLSRVSEERGLDLAPYLIGMFYDIGPKTDQVRCAYYDTMSA